MVGLILAVFPDGGPSEAAVVRFHDPGSDLDRRASAWGAGPIDPSLAGVAKFCGGLALAEAEARREGDDDVALRAYLDRRLLLGDRFLHWAIPVLVAVEGPGRRPARRAADKVLGIGDALRPVPVSLGGEGLTIPGEDVYGPLAPDVPPAELSRSIWSGWARPEPGPAEPSDAATYGEASVFWRALADDHPGSAGLWRDLAARAAATAARLENGGLRDVSR